jgi:hypothetical protein
MKKGRVEVAAKIGLPEPRLSNRQQGRIASALPE